MKEGFKPLPNIPSNGFLPTLLNTIRMVFDLQLLTIVKDVKREFPKFHGDVLDIGCGDSPYRVFLKLDKVKYLGIDIVDQDKFDYRNERIVPFDGKKYLLMINILMLLSVQRCLSMLKIFTDL